MLWDVLLTELKRFYRKNGRGHLPWRKTRDPYRILVSEVMLQQTQVERVIPKYEEFIRAFPNVEALANATFAQVLSHWSGLGYNRRARYLHEASKTVVREYGGAFPRSAEALQELPGIGPYTARAIAAFAFNEPGVFIETNIRTVFTHLYFPERFDISNRERKVSDAELLPLIARDLRRSKMAPREFYAALMDYGSHLKRSGVRLNSRSAHYIKQSKFEGSSRQLRGAILRELLKRPASVLEIRQNFASAKKSPHHTEEKIIYELKRLENEGLIRKSGMKFTLAD